MFTLIGDSYYAATYADAYSAGTGTATATAGDVIGGNDTLVGGADDDEITGDYAIVSTSFSSTTSGTAGALINGDDTIEGGAGNDRVWGDTQSASGVVTTAGNDTFVFRSAANGTFDFIMDYTAWTGTAGDTILLDGYEAGDITTAAFDDGTYQGTQVTLTGGQEIFVVGVLASDLHFDFVV